MADNFAFTAGSGVTGAADDIGGVLHQRVKISQGADGTAVDVSSAAPLNVTLANTAANTNKLLVTPDLPTGAATAAKQPALGTAGTASTDVITVQGIASGTAQPVSGTVAVSSYPALPTGSNAIGKLTSNTGVIIGDVNVVSNIPGVAATSLGKAEDAAHTSGDTGVLGLAVRRDADTTLVDTTGDYAPLQVNAAGSLKVAITAGAGSGGTSLADNAGFTPGTTSFTPIGGEVDDTGTTAATENSAGIVRMTGQRAFHVNLRDNAGAELSVGGGTQYTEDAAAAADPVGNVLMGIRRDTLSASEVSADGDNIAIKATSKGQLHVKIDTGQVPDVGQTTMSASVPVTIASNQSAVTVSQSASTVPTATTMQSAAGTGNPNGTSLPVTGYATAIINIVSSTAMSGGTTVNFEVSVDDTTFVPILAHQVGAVGNLVSTTTVDGDYRVNVSGYKSIRARISAWSAGVTTIKGYPSVVSAQPTTVSLGGDPSNPLNFVSGAITSAMTGTTSTSLVAAPGASLRNYITTIVCSNSHATVGTDIAIQDGSGGTTLMTIPAAAVYGGSVVNLQTPLRQPTTNTALFCANVTTGASTKVSAVGYKGT